MKVTDKDISSKKNLLGQFLTPIQVAEFCLSKIEIKEHTVIEPSCGTGAFLDLIPETKEIIGIEYDETMINNYKGKHKIIHNN